MLKIQEHLMIRIPQPQKLHVTVRPYMIQQLSAALRDEQ